jgi:hypothetical protein
MEGEDGYRNGDGDVWMEMELEIRMVMETRMGMEKETAMWGGLQRGQG